LLLLCFPWDADGALGFCRRRREAALQKLGCLMFWMLPKAATMKLLSCLSLSMTERWMCGTGN